ncbi:FAD-dependent oxidoreductase [Luedemannella flava]|uniref:FAD-dependent oxidoreductase n=1 Tax=Luedemannella flava TaxID=349316 RepID=A0ABP4Y964_9ACTN
MVGSHTIRASLADAENVPFWLDRSLRPEAQPPLTGPATADLAIVGGGYSGLWTALLAKQADPALDVLIVERGVCGGEASGRNGGFCASSLTHGPANGSARFPDEADTLVALGQRNLDAIGATIAELGIDCDWERTGELSVATASWQLATLDDEVALAERFGQRIDVLDAEATRAELNSPTYLGGVWHRDTTALLDPAKLAWGLRRACLDAGVRIAEHTEVTGLRADGAALRLTTAAGPVRAGRVVLATNAFAPLLRRLRAYIAPVYDYAVVTEPLTTGQLDSLGWRNRQGLSDSANQFHYYRVTADNRILWGGYDAIYHYGNRIRPDLERRPATFELLAGQFFETFPQLAGEVRFSHQWAGVIDTCSRFCAFFGSAYGGRLAYATGYTGLGVGATRFGAAVMLELLRAPGPHDWGPVIPGRALPGFGSLTSLRFVRSKPVPFPPEPARYLGIQATRWSLARADARDGRRNLWLRTLDRLGLGFDS